MKATMNNQTDRMLIEACSDLDDIMRALGIIGAYDLTTVLNEIKKLHQTAPSIVSTYEEVLADHRRLVRELDVALNGQEGAAKQASLCDIVRQVTDNRWKLVRADANSDVRIAVMK
jgi:hypothetical protein